MREAAHNGKGRKKESESSLAFDRNLRTKYTARNKLTFILVRKKN